MERTALDTSDLNRILDRLTVLDQSVRELLTNVQSQSKEINAQLAALAKYRRPEQGDDLNRLVDLDELQDRLKVSRSTARRLIGIVAGYPAKIQGAINLGTLAKPNWRIPEREVRKHTGQSS